MHCDDLFADGMSQRQRNRMKRDAAWERCRTVITRVSQDRKSAVRELCANLVLSPSLQLNLQKRNLGIRCQQSPRKTGPLSLRPWSSRHASSSGGVIAPEPVFQLSALPVRLSGDKGPVGLGNRVLSKLFGESCCRFGCSREDECSSDWRIESADDTQIDTSGFVVFVPDVRLRKIQDRRFIGSRAHRRHRSWFVDDQQMVVLIKDLQRFWTR